MELISIGKTFKIIRTGFMKIYVLRCKDIKHYILGPISHFYVNNF